ncbi:MAG: ribokinase [Rhodobacteraceae bacterium]|nr:ribokinase [Paracoccaceae bacterium]
MNPVVILGVFVADTAYRAERQPRMGETILGRSFVLGPGGKGSNQAVAAARAGGEVHFISRLGRDAFADMARATWAGAGVRPVITEDPASYTGAAYIFIEDATGNNAIIIAPGAAARIDAADIEASRDLIAGARVAVTQLEQPVGAALRFLQIARAGGATTILNPAPAAPLPDEMLALCDYVTPNESEAEALTGLPVTPPAEAERAADALIARGPRAAVITLGEKGALLRRDGISVHVPVFDAGPVVETTGAGDAFNGGFAVAPGRGAQPRRGGPLRLRHRRHQRHPARHRALDAFAGRDRGAARRLKDRPAPARRFPMPPSRRALTTIVAVLALGAALPAAGQDAPALDIAVLTGCLSAAAGDDAARRACIGRAASACMQSESGQTTAGSVSCLAAERDWWEARRATAFAEVLARMRRGDAELAGLGSAAPARAPLGEAAEAAWAAWKAAECAFEAAQWDGGTGAGPAAAACDMQITGERALWHEAALAGD